MNLSGGRPGLVVYCARSWALSSFVTTRTFPLLSPKLDADSPGLIDRLDADLVYIRLHGLPDQPYFYGDPGWATALTYDQIRRGSFDGSHVFLEGCYGSAAAASFIEAGAASVSGCRIATWGHPFWMGPSSQVGRSWLTGMMEGESPSQALKRGVDSVRFRFSVGWETYYPGGSNG